MMGLDVADQQAVGDDDRKDDVRDVDQGTAEDDGWYDYDEDGNEYWTNGCDVDYSEYGTINAIYGKGKGKRKGKRKVKRRQIKQFQRRKTIQRRQQQRQFQGRGQRLVE